MSEGIRKKIMVVLMVGVMVWAYFNMTPSTSPPASVDRPQTIQPITSAGTGATTGERLNVDQKSKAPWGRDPFRPVTVASVPKSSRRQVVHNDWQLSGILYNSQSAVAIINNKPVKIGDTINDARVVQIDKKEVVLEHKGKRIRLTVAKG